MQVTKVLQDPDHSQLRNNSFCQDQQRNQQIGCQGNEKVATPSHYHWNLQPHPPVKGKKSLKQILFVRREMHF